MLILAVYLMQGTLLRDLRETASPKLPNVFLIDITTDEIAGVKEFFAHQPGVTQPLDLIAGRAGAICFYQWKVAGRHERAAFSAAHAGECRTELGRRTAEGDKVIAGQVVDRCGTRRRSRWVRALRSGCIWASDRQMELEVGRRRTHAERRGDLSRRRPASGSARGLCVAFGTTRRTSRRRGMAARTSTRSK